MHVDVGAYAGLCMCVCVCVCVCDLVHIHLAHTVHGVFVGEDLPAVSLHIGVCVASPLCSQQTNSTPMPTCTALHHHPTKSVYLCVAGEQLPLCRYTFTAQWMCAWLYSSALR